MIDIHCHILPELDDGAADLRQALRMAEEAVAEGIHFVFATPHHGSETYDNDAMKVYRAVRDFNRELVERGIPLHVMPGQEVRAHAALIDEILSGAVLTLNDGPYLLMELPPTCIPPYMEELLHELRVLRVIPIIAHPERHPDIGERMAQWVELGALGQVNAHSLLGLFGKRVQKNAFSLCRQNLVHFIASDGHRPDFRPIRLQAAFQLVEGQLGEHYARHYRDNAQKLLDGETIDAQLPVRPSRRWFVRWNGK